MPRSLIALLVLLAGPAQAADTLADAALRCARGEAAGCTALAEAHRGGGALPASPLREAVLRAHACGLGDADSCAALGLAVPTTLAEALASPPPMDVPDPAGIRLLLAACDGGVLDACLAVARQLDHDLSGDLAPLVVQPLRDASDSLTARALLHDQRWLDEPLPPHLWRAAEPLGPACEAGDAEACDAGRRALMLERASARPVAMQVPLAMKPPGAEPPPSSPERWVEVTVPLGAGASFSSSLPLLSLGAGVRGGLGAFAASLDVAFLPQADKPLLEATYRRSVLAAGAGAAIPLAPFARLHVGAAFAVGDWTTAPGGTRFSLGVQEYAEVSWVFRPASPRSATLGFRIQVHQLADLAGQWDHVAAARLVLGLRFVSARR